MIERNEKNQLISESSQPIPAGQTIEISVFNTPDVFKPVDLTVKITRMTNSCINWTAGYGLKIAFWPTVNVNSNLISGEYHFIIVIDRNEKKLLVMESKFDRKENKTNQNKKNQFKKICFKSYCSSCLHISA